MIRPTGTTLNCIADVSVTILTFWDRLGTGKDSRWGTGAIDDAMPGYVKVFLLLTLRFFHDVHHAKKAIVYMIPWFLLYSWNSKRHKLP